MHSLTLFEVVDTIFLSVKFLLFKVFGISIRLLVEWFLFFITVLLIVWLLLSYFERPIIIQLLFLIVWWPYSWVTSVFFIVIGNVFGISHWWVAFIFLFWCLPISLRINKCVCLLATVLVGHSLRIIESLLIIFVCRLLILEILLSVCQLFTVLTVERLIHYIRLVESNQSLTTI